MEHNFFNRINVLIVGISSLGVAVANFLVVTISDWVAIYVRDVYSFDNSLLSFCAAALIFLFLLESVIYLVPELRAGLIKSMLDKKDERFLTWPIFAAAWIVVVVLLPVFLVEVESDIAPGSEVLIMIWIGFRSLNILTSILEAQRAGRAAENTPN